MPVATRLHPRWPDYQLLRGVLEKAVAEGQRLLLVAEKPAVFSHWLVRTTVDAATVEIGRLLGASPSQYRSLFGPTAGEFTACVVLLPETHFRHSGELLQGVAPLLVPGAQISLVAMNERPASVAAKFAQALASQTGAWSTCPRGSPMPSIWDQLGALEDIPGHAMVRGSREPIPLVFPRPAGAALYSAT